MSKVVRGKFEITAGMLPLIQFGLQFFHVNLLSARLVNFHLLPSQITPSQDTLNVYSAVQH